MSRRKHENPMARESQQRNKDDGKNIREKLSKSELNILYTEQQLSAKEIADLYQVTSSTILAIIEEYGIKKRSKSEAFLINYQKNPNVNVDFFKNMSPKLAYILGLWATDGSINKQGTISLSLIDKDVIEWVANVIDCKNPIKVKYVKDRKPFFTVHFQNPVVQDIFKEYGIIHNKTRVLEFPDLPEEYLHYYVRGVFEGDGSISIGQTKRGHLEQSITFCGASLPFMEKIKTIVESVIGGDRKISNVKEYNQNKMKYNFYIYTFGGREDVIKFGDWMYSGTFFGMERKYKKFQQLKKLHSENSMKIEQAKALFLQKDANIPELIKDLTKEGIKLSFKDMVTKEILHELYWNKNMTLYDIADLYQTSASVVLKVMEEWNIPRRDSKYVSKFDGKLTKEVLYDLYWNKNLSLQQIANIYETNASTILKYMDKFTIPRRKNVSKLAELTQEELRRLYWEENLTLKEIGKMFDIADTAILKLMKQWDIPRRTRAEKVLADLRRIVSVVSGTCLDPENYNGTRNKLTWECSKGHTFTRTPRKISEYGKWCPLCHGEDKILKNIK